MRCELESNCGVVEETVRQTLISLQTGQRYGYKENISRHPGHSVSKEAQPILSDVGRHHVSGMGLPLLFVQFEMGRRRNDGVNEKRLRR